MVEYKYDSWANHAVLDANGADIASATHIGNLNPFRYRGYYYDAETGLYFLKTRYYDPEVGRFITIDDISYIDPETINGLNLYAYCGNNPVMGYDPDGTWDWGRFWSGIAIAVAAVVAVAITVATFGTGSVAGGIIIGGIIGAAGNLFSQTVIEGKSFAEVDYWQVALGGVTGALSAIPGVGLIGGAGISGLGGFASALIEGKSLEDAALSGLWSAGTAILKNIYGNRKDWFRYFLVNWF